MSDTLHISAEALEEDRFSRFRLIGWWDQAKLRSAKVLVVGAGALGNEIVKNLALLGVGNVLIADLDRIENSNLSRSVLYRAADAGRFKADVAAESAKQIYPDLNAHAFVGNVVYDLGLGVFQWADVILGGLDNREARLSLNRAAWKCNKPWIDGAIQQLDGVARVFIPESHPLGTPDAACYECTMSATDWRLLNLRRSCNLLSKSEMEQGKTPTTPTISSIIAGVQCQEAIKVLHGMESLAGKGFVFSGMTADSYLTTYQRKADCFSHDTLDRIEPMPWSAETTTVADALAHARQVLGPETELELARDVLHKLVCPRCGREELMFTSLGKVLASAARCPHCVTPSPGTPGEGRGEGDFELNNGTDAQNHPHPSPLPGYRERGPEATRREAVTFYKIRGDEDFLHRTLAQIGVPPFDILIARNGAAAVGLELSADAARVLGPLASSAPPAQAELEWT